MIDYLPALAGLPDESCRRPWTWFRPEGDEVGDVRGGLFRCLEDELQAASEVTGTSEPARLLAGAQAANGELRAILAPIPSSWRDTEPASGEWSLRQVLHHILEGEIGARANTKHALGRGPQEPLSIPRERRPGFDPGDVSGTIVEILERIDQERRATDLTLGDIPSALLTRPSEWAGFKVDVRFRLGRFASHIVEHTVQVETTLQALGHRPGEAALIVRRISAARGRHERFTDPVRILRLDAHHRVVLRAALTP